MKNIVCFHLFNDYSGSPQVLRTVIEGLLKKGYNVDLVTSRGGVLDELEGKENLRMRQYNYRFARNKLVRCMRYAWVQLQVFFIALGYMFRKDTVIYINTILPIGAAIGGRLACKKVVYHYHENAKAKSTPVCAVTAVSTTESLPRRSFWARWLLCRLRSGYII